jgi:UDP-N-acetylglucosamine diphosphorylase/glucosamine-1-phosphate N-acetyltransferase
VQSFTRVQGPTWIGPHTIVGGDKIIVCAIGDHCKVHGEVGNSVFLGHANKAHDGFLGHSYLGRWVNLGANTVTSNLKNTYGHVALWTPGGIRTTDLQFLGTLFGDHVKTGIGLTLTTGCVIGAGSQLYGSQMPPKVVPPFSWGDTAPYQTFELEKFLVVAERVMARRHVTLDERGRRYLRQLFETRWQADA